MTEAPKTGDVFHYPYLWAWQADLGETEGRKDRPCCVALVIPLKSGLNRVYILPITTKKPAGDEVAVSIPRTEVSRAGLSSDYDQWIILSEWNREIYEQSYYISDRTGTGSFSRAFTDQLLERLKALLSAGAITTILRE
ncbi:MAG: hypothetical protein AAGA63_14130 [Pseudomonadota bacterium]